MELTIGDIVKHRAGGPEMVVTEITIEKDRFFVSCERYCRTRESFMAHKCPVECLEKV